MLKVADIVAYMKTAVPYTYYPNEFPTQATDDIAYVRLTGGFRPSEWTTKKRPSFQIAVRAKLNTNADAKANEIYAYLHNKREFTIGTTRIVSCTADQSSPLYLGVDENGRTIYSVNFTVTTIE